MTNLSAFKSRSTLAICILLLVLPAVLLLCYIHLFGVSVVFWDEWAIVPLFEKMNNGWLTPSDFFLQHAEHRTPFGKIAMLAIASVTQWNTRYEMLFSWTLLCISSLILFRIYARESSGTLTPRILLAFVPVSYLLFSLRQYESVLRSFPCIMYLMISGVIATFSVLETIRRENLRLMLGLSTAVLASFSHVAGLLVWPVGFFQLSMSGRIRLRDTVIWAFTSVIVGVIYFYGFKKPSWVPPYDYALKNPIESAQYFLTLLGAVFSFGTAMSAPFGLAVLVIAALVIGQVCRAKLVKGNVVWLSLVLFGFLSCVADTVGRGAFGIRAALSSTYTPMTTLGIIGLYLLALLVCRSSPARNRSYAVYMLLTLILVGSIASYSLGWQAGQVTKFGSFSDCDLYFKEPPNRQVAAYVLKTYKIQSDQNLIKYVHPVLSSVRKYAPFLEQNKLNVFSGPPVIVSKLVPVDSQTLFGIDTINGATIPSLRDGQQVQVSSRGDTITIQGWAVDTRANDSASAVFISIDEKIDIPTLYGLDREDVAKDLKRETFKSSGFLATFSSSILTKGEHVISLKIVTKDGTHYYQVGPILHLVVE